MTITVNMVIHIHEQFHVRQHAFDVDSNEKVYTDFGF